MALDKAELLAQLAKGNPVDLDKVLEVQRQLAELEQAGIVRRTSPYVDSPLGHPVLVQRPQVLANASAQLTKLV